MLLGTFIRAWARVIVSGGLVLRSHISYAFDALTKGRFFAVVTRTWILFANLDRISPNVGSLSRSNLSLNAFR